LKSHKVAKFLRSITGREVVKVVRS